MKSESTYSLEISNKSATASRVPINAWTYSSLVLSDFCKMSCQESKLSSDLTKLSDKISIASFIFKMPLATT